MEDDYGWGDISEDYFFEEEEYSPEELAAQDRAERQQALQEAYAEFLDAPNCFDWGSLGGAPLVSIQLRKALKSSRINVWGYC